MKKIPVSILAAAVLWAALVAHHFTSATASPSKPPATAVKATEIKGLAQRESPAGKWKATGSHAAKNEDGETVQIKYTANVLIVKDPDADRFVAEWLMTKDGKPILGAPVILGVGFLDGDSLVIGWSLVGPVQHQRGCTIYRWAVKKLEGRWTMLPGPIGVETLERVPEPEPQKPPDVE